VNDRLNDSELADFARGDSGLWRRFLAVQIPRLYGLFMSRWPNRSLAEELVSKTVFDAVRGLKTFDGSKGGPEQWLFAIARNNIRLEIRRRAARPGIDGDLASYLEVIDDEPLPDEILERKSTAEAVRQALSKLNEKERDVLMSKYVENLSAGQIAAGMNLTEKAVHSLLYRARQSLRDELKRTAPLYTEER
jgi:RNA polymerase sigma-70 factor (ECF subfamily)